MVRHRLEGSYGRRHGISSLFSRKFAERLSGKKLDYFNSKKEESSSFLKKRTKKLLQAVADLSPART